MVGVPSGSATYNVQGSTLHHLLSIGVSRPEENIAEKATDKLKSQLKKLLCLIIDKRSMLSSKALAATVRNIRKTVYNGQNTQEIWGCIPAVLLFGNDYQLWPVIEEGAIQGYFKMSTTGLLAPTNKLSAAQLLRLWGSYLFTHVMTELVFFLDKKYRVKLEQFSNLLGNLCTGEYTPNNAKKITNLHLAYYKHDTTFMTKLKQDQKTMWIYAKNMDIKQTWTC
jgi:hypothetical protein